MNLGPNLQGEYRMAAPMEAAPAASVPPAPGPAPDRQTTVTTPDGLSLHVELFRPAATTAAGSAVLIHGFSAHSGNYRHVAQGLANAGIATWLYDSRGHGRSQ